MHYINVSDLAPANWHFIKPFCTDPELSWEFHSGQPQNWLESRIRRPDIGRYRAARAAVLAAKARPDAVLVSHLPSSTRAVAWMMRLYKVRRPHIAFSFNFTGLPPARKHAALARSFAGVTEFVVHSRHEAAAYAHVFGLPAERMHFLPWAMEPPVAAPDTPPPFTGPYLSAIGGEGRDYHTLAEAMRLLPDLNLALVARPHSIAGIDFPPNVRVAVNLPVAETWAIARGSVAMAVPLRDARTANGHITLIAAQHLGIPLVVTRSEGVADYVDAQSATLVAPGDAPALAAALAARAAHPDRAGAEATRLRALETNTPAAWVRYFSDLDRRLRRE